MRISAISNVAPKTLKTQKQNQVHNNVNTQTSSGVNSLPKLNYSDVLFKGDPTRREILSKADWHTKHVARVIQDIDFYAKKTDEAAPQIFNSITEEETKATDTINDVYKIADEGFKKGFEPFTKEDGTKVEFEINKEEGKNQQTTMLEYDKDGNLTREAELDGVSVKSITLYGANSIDEIEVENSKPIKILRGITSETSKDENSKEMHKIKYAYVLDDPEEKTVYYNMVRRGFDDYSAERIYDFTNDGKLKYMYFFYTREPNGSENTQIQMKYRDNKFSEKSKLSTVLKNVSEDFRGNLSAEQEVVMHSDSEYPNRIKENFKRNADGTRESEHVYAITTRLNPTYISSHIKGERLPKTRLETNLKPLLVMVKSGEKVTDGKISADKIYIMRDKGLEYYMENCSRKKGDRQYLCERKVKF